MENILLPLIQAIHDQRKATSSPAPNTAARQSKPSVLVQLEAFLATDDTRASDLWCESAPLLESLLGPETMRLGTEIANFQFDQALLTLRRAMLDKSRPGASTEPADEVPDLVLQGRSPHP